MKKPADLRAYLAQRVPLLAAQPDALDMWIEKGNIFSVIGTNLSFEYRYELSILVKDYTDHADTLVIPCLAWISINQPDILQAPDKQETGFRFEAEIVDHERTDVLLILALTERVVVTVADDVYTATHCAEPALPDLSGPTGWEMHAGGVVVTP